MTCNSLTCQTTQQSPFQASQPLRWTGQSVSIWQVLGAWYDRWQQRQHLADLDDRLLDDIGLRRSDVEQQIKKPFWMI